MRQRRWAEWYRSTRCRLSGHEIAGMVEAVGEGVTGYRAGDRGFRPQPTTYPSAHATIGMAITRSAIPGKTSFDPGGFAGIREAAGI